VSTAVQRDALGATASGKAVTVLMSKVEPVVRLPSPVGSSVEITAWDIPLILLFFVLVCITLFRKRLSCNDHFRVEEAVSSSSSSPGSGSSGGSTKTSGSTSNSLTVDLLSLGHRHFFSKMAAAAVFLDNSNEAERDGQACNSNSSNNNDKRNSKDIMSKLAPELMLQIMSFLTHEELCILGCLSHTLARETRSDFIWEQLWLQAYSSMWNHERIAAIRRLRGIAWDPTANWGPPSQGWFLFFWEFESCWTDWLLAGCCTNEFCLIGLGGSIHDITEFLPHHPGSLEVLMEMCGGEATTAFAEIGHSSRAIELAQQYVVWERPRHLQQSYQYCPPAAINTTHRGRQGHTQKHRVSTFQMLMAKEKAEAEQAAVAGNALLGDFSSSISPSSSTSFATAAAAAAGAVVGVGAAASTSPYLEEETTFVPLVSPGMLVMNRCKRGKRHFGQVRAIYDPLSQEWACWWSCCSGVEQVLINAGSSSSNGGGSVGGSSK